MNSHVKDAGSEFPTVADFVKISAQESPGYWTLVGKRLLKDPVTIIAGMVLLLIVLSAIFAPWLSPYDPYKGDIMTRMEAGRFRGPFAGHR